MAHRVIYNMFIVCGILATNAIGQPGELSLGVNDENMMNVLENLVLDTNGRDRVILDPADLPVPTENVMPKPADATGSCEGNFTDETGKLASPKFPNSNYPPNSNCSWEIRVQQGKLIRIKFDYMDIEVGPPECPFDGVLVVDYGKMWDAGINPHLHGPVAAGVSDPQVPPTALGEKRYCGQESFDPIVSISNAVRIGFYSDSDSEGGGFVISWDTIDQPRVEEIKEEEEQPSCDFEDGFCRGWENVQTGEDIFDWTINSGKTKTLNTGPSVDHTTNKQDGKYAFIEGSKPQQENDTALLSSPEMTFADGETDFCIDFWYHMYGSGIGSLVVGVAVNENRKIEWIKSGNQGDKWRHATVGIKRVENPLKIIFAGVRGDAYTSDIAIDDIVVHRKPCSTIKSNGETVNRFIEPPVPEHECEGDDYPCMDGVTCVKDSKLCDGNPDCPGKDDESDFLCIVDFNATTAVPPLSETTADYETGTPTYYDETTYLVTTVPAWMLNLTTFGVEITDEVTTEESDNNKVTTRKSITESVTESASTTYEKVKANTTNTTFQTKSYKTTQIVEETTDAFETTDSGEITTVHPETTTFKKGLVNDITTTPSIMISSTIQSTISSTTPEQVETIPTTLGESELSPSTITSIELSETTKKEAIPPTTGVIFEETKTTTTELFKSSKSVETFKTTSQGVEYTREITDITSEPIATTTEKSIENVTEGTTQKAIEKEVKATENKFTPRPSPKSVKVAITAVAIEPTGLAEKQEGGTDGSSAVRVSPSFIIHLLISSLFVLFINKWI